MNVLNRENPREDCPVLHRCPWGDSEDMQMRQYHDLEWGTPLHDSRALFELLSLELMQSGLSWRTILHKRQGFIRAFHNFDPHVVVTLDAEGDGLLSDPSIIRNRRKIQAVINNAAAIVALENRGISFNEYVWQFVNHESITNQVTDYTQSPCQSPISITMSKSMKRDGFSFVGPVVVYSFMEAAGLVNDHESSCFRWAQLAQGRQSASQVLHV
ncbi:DNA-3-methyladenine glycosylase I [Bifidobacterium crudilactis]|uniref:DNA-3-methyladenine glycosylase I n=1 Tax=Bifidobacterium crudilactis TaxID=327277 RepID=UPI00235459DB|nr:DNA-3-methyladenine glycosylase I [Bifidobacterium crudilactis]MCI1218660.1 DNA-3-methyladenine glycosylase I [Bifidobacterium crudilactis]